MGRKKEINVVAALIWRKDTFMICQRPVEKVRGLLWEFVGGKVKPGETKKDALIRECKEELGAVVQPLDVYAAVKYVYPDVVVRLTLFNASIVQGPIRKLEHNDIKWITVEQIDDFEFCPADEEILAKLKDEFVHR